MDSVTSYQVLALRLGILGALLPCVVAQGACRDEVAVAHYQAVDSSGVDVVTTTPAGLEKAEEWRVLQEPTFTVGSQAVDDSVVLFRVGAIANLSDGGLAVANGGSLEILLFDSERVLTGRIGRAGDGPGEFREIGDIFTIGDTLVAYDPTLRRATLFHHDGRIARDLDLRSAIDGVAYTRLLPIGPTSWAMFSVRGFPDEVRDGVMRVPSECISLGTDGSVQGSFGSFPGNEVFIVNAGAGMALFGRRSFAAASESRLYVTTGETAEVQVFGEDAQLMRIVRWPHDPRPVTQSDVDQMIERLLPSVPEEQRAAARGMAADLPRADFWPVVDGLHGGDEGDLWVGTYAGPTAALPEQTPPAREWLVFAANGVLKARVHTPEGFKLMLVHDGTLLGVFVDDFGSESVRGYSYAQR